MKKGFILLELLIAFAISSIVMGGLFTVINQTNQAVLIMDRIASIDMRTLLLQSQLERDLSGAFVPQERQESVRQASADAKAMADRQDDRGEKKDKKTSEKDKKKTEKKKKEYEDVPLKKAFLSKHKGQNLELLTFITTNPLPAYDTLKPRIVRVAYKVVPEKQQIRGEAKPSFELLRQEHETLGFAAFEKKKPRAYKVIKNIKKLGVEYVVRIQKGEQDKAKKSGQDTNKDSEPKFEYLHTSPASLL